ncbi:MAG: DUF805 domain-containing protein [Bradyrhizobium sp.]|nr:DUF805 domain-containing protein [Bradyrhizobium sp.]
MDWTWYLFSFEGRINRAKYWLAGLVIVSLMLAFLGLGYLALTIDFVEQAMGTPPGGGKVSFGFNVLDIFSVLDPAAWRSLSFAKLPMVLVKAIGTVLFFWIFLATSIKRLHDRDKSGWWMVPFFAVPHLYNHFSDLLPDSYFVLIPAGIAFVLMIWAFVELYFLSGSRKTNRFGPNPLLQVPAERRWEQHSEIEMVPHTASPPPVWRVKPEA